MSSDQQELFDSFVAPLIGLPVTHAWQGYGSAILLEFGAQAPTVRRDGSPGHPEGEMGLMIEWSWRIEGRRSILLGSWSDESRWRRGLACLTNGLVTSARTVGRLPEIELTLSTELHVASMNTSTGDPAWVLFDRRGQRTRWLKVRRGRLCVDDEPIPDA